MKEVPVKRIDSKVREKEITRRLDKLAQIAERKIPLQEKVDLMNGEMLQLLRNRMN